jgi:Protein of unknown function (DUF4446)
MGATITNTQGIVAIAGAAVAVVALITSAYVALAVRRLRAAQATVLGELGERDLATHAMELHEAFGGLREYVEESSARLDARLAATETALQGAIAHRALVRYDAYNEQSGQQSFSIAVLDETHSGVVISCINHRDQARVYAKQVHQGEGELTLSPEETEAVNMALAGSARDGAGPRRAVE